MTSMLVLGSLSARADSMLSFDAPAVSAPVASVRTFAAKADAVGSEELSLPSAGASMVTPAAVTPEPSSVVLLGTGLVGSILLIGRKRRMQRGASLVNQGSSSEGVFAPKLGAVART